MSTVESLGELIADLYAQVRAGQAREARVTEAYQHAVAERDEARREADELRAADPPSPEPSADHGGNHV